MFQTRLLGGTPCFIAQDIAFSGLKCEAHAEVVILGSERTVIGLIPIQLSKSRVFFRSKTPNKSL